MNLHPAAWPISLLALLSLTGPCQGRAQEPQGVLAPAQGEAAEARAVAARLQGGHYRHQPLDDRLSARMLERYLDFLDPWHGLFTVGDVTSFGRYRDKLDDALRGGKLEPAFEIFGIYRERARAQSEYLLAAVRGDLSAVNLGDEEFLELDRENAPRPADRVALEDLWRRRFENDVLSEKLRGNSPEEIKKKLESRYQSQLRFEERTRSEDVFQLFLNALAQSYDPHTQYLGRKSAEDFDIDMSLSVEGIGAQLRSDGEYVGIERLIHGGPAEESGLLSAGDRVVTVAQGKDSEPVDVVGWRTDEVADLIRGPSGSIVRVSVLAAGEPEGSAPRVVELVREAVSLEEQAAVSHIVELGEGEKARKIGVIDLPAFYMDFEGFHRGDAEFRSTTRDVGKLLQSLAAEGVAGVVLDLRQNGGGSLIEVNELGGLFVGQVPMVQVRDANGEVDVLTPGSPALYSGPLLVLVDRLSASASEIFAGAVQDYGRGLVVGERTFGKGTVQGIVPTTAGELILTQAKFYRVTGASTQLRGVTPDLTFPDGFDPEEIGEEALPEALPWDEIKPVEDLKTGRLLVRELLPELKDEHERRAAKDPDFARARALLDYREELGREQRVSLDEDVREAEQETHEARLLAIENSYRALRGEEPLEKLDTKTAAHPDPEELDPFQREAARILSDYIDGSRPR